MDEFDLLNPSQTNTILKMKKESEIDRIDLMQQEIHYLGYLVVKSSFKDFKRIRKVEDLYPKPKAKTKRTKTTKPTLTPDDLKAIGW